MEIRNQIGLFDDARQIRQEVFVEEQGFDLEFDELDPICNHVVLYLDGFAVATARTYKEGEYDIIGRVAVRKEYRKHHLGKKVMQAIENIIIEHGGTKIKLSAQVQASQFYASLGYHQIGEQYLDEHCPHITMIKKIMQ